MSLYIIEDDDGNVLTNDGDFDNNIIYAALYDEPLEPAKDIERYGGHVVTLVEEPKKVVVSEEETEMLERLRTDENASPAGAIRNYFWGSVEGQNVDNKPRWSRENEARLMSAYVNGYTVAKEKKYNLILGTDTGDSTNALFKLVNYNPCTDDALGLDADTYADDLKLDELYQFTQEEIDKYNKDFWIKNIDLNDYKIEVTDDEQ